MLFNSKLRILILSSVIVVSKIASADDLIQQRSCADLLNLEVEFRGSVGIVSPKVIITTTDHQGRKRQVEYSFTSRGLSAYQAMLRGIPSELIPNPKTMQGQSILDAGTGPGKFVFDMRASGHNSIYGIDPYLSPEQLELPGVFFREDMRKTSFSSNSFDTIYSTWSIFHIQYEANNESFLTEVLIELKRILKPKGRIVIYADQNLPVFERAVNNVGNLYIEMLAGGEDGSVTILRKD